MSIENPELNVKKLKIHQEHPELLKHPKVLQSLLRPLEEWCLREMLKANTPLSTGELRRTIANDLLLGLFEAKKIDDATAKEIIELSRSKKSVARIGDELTKLTGRYLRVPSYSKLENALGKLESWNMITKMFEDTKRTNVKYFWVLTPAFSLEYGDTLRDYFSKQPHMDKYRMTAADDFR